MTAIKSYFDSFRTLKELKEALDCLEAQRDKLRARTKVCQLTYDCCSCKTDGKKAWCTGGHVLVKIDAISVLQGRTPLICRGCKDFDGD